jgi:hypothetical protein
MDIEHFVRLLVNSQLFGEVEAKAARSAFDKKCNGSNMPATVNAFCDYLISGHSLTAWQCEKLRMGKWKGFYLDNYLIMEPIEKCEQPCFYKARNTRDGKLVRLEVIPFAYADGRIQYRVAPYSE